MESRRPKTKLLVGHTLDNAYPRPLPKEPLNKELITLAYIVTVVVVLNISLHNNVS